MKHVRLPLVSREFLTTHVDTEALVRENTECKELLLEAMRYHLLPEQRSSLASIRTTSRKPDGMKPYLFAIGKTIFWLSQHNIVSHQISHSSVSSRFPLLNVCLSLP